MNNFYNTYKNPGTMDNLLLNSTFEGHIHDGMWTFDTTPIIDTAPFASYIIYNEDGTYGNLPLDLAGKFSNQKDLNAIAVWLCPGRN